MFTYAAAAALLLVFVFRMTESMMWITPLSRMTSGWMMSAVVSPWVTYCPVELTENEKVSPPCEVKLRDPVSRGEYRGGASIII